MMEVYHFFADHPFITGLLIGIIATLYVWLNGLLKSRELRKEIASLKESMFTKMQIEAKGSKTREDELEELRKQNENLRITVGSLRQKPGAAELRQLHVYDHAVHAMLGRAPGFAPSWEMALKEAEEAVARSDTGFGAFVRKVFITQKIKPGDTSEHKLIDHEPTREE